MKKTILLFMMFIGLIAINTANAQNYMNVYHSGGINSYDVTVVPSVKFTATDMLINNSGTTVPYVMNNVSKITFGVATSINEKLLSSSVTTYPNPTSGTFTLNIENENSADYVVNIYNIAGSLISTNTYQGNVVNEQIDLSNQVNGIYMIMINNGNNVITKKIVKN